MNKRKLLPLFSGLVIALMLITGSASSAGLLSGLFPPGKLNLSASSYSVAQNGATLIISVTRTGGSSGAASVAYSTSNGTAFAGTHYTAMSGRLNWNSGDAKAKTFSVPIRSVAGFAGSKTFTVALSSASGATLGTQTSATATINGSGAAPPPPPPPAPPPAPPPSPPPASGSKAAALAARLGKPSRFLVGLGGVNVPDLQAQSLRPDIFERYLPDYPFSSWVNFNSPPGSYVDDVVAQADSVGAVPMFTLYQMVYYGDGNLRILDDRAQMQRYWQQVVLLFDRLKAYGKPALVNFEPDFWGYVQLQTPNVDPTERFAWVNITPDCASLPNDVTGVGKCLLAIARKRAPLAEVGFPPANFGQTTAQITSFMTRVGAATADFIVMQTLDRDAGCYEARYVNCTRETGAVYYDATNQTSPNFRELFAEGKSYSDGIGGLPLLWWQTPLGVPSQVSGGTEYRFRDNKVDYFLRKPQELVAVGAIGAVFSTGEDHQTNITTDGGQFRTRLNAYLAAPAPLP